MEGIDIMTAGMWIVACVLAYLACGWLTVFVMGLFDGSYSRLDDLLWCAFICWPLFIIACLIDWTSEFIRWVNGKMDAVSCVSRPVKATFHCLSYIFKPYSVGWELRKCFSKKKKEESQ